MGKPNKLTEWLAPRVKTGLITFIAAIAVVVIMPAYAQAYTLSNSYFNVVTGTNGEITSLKLTGDTYPTNYVLNATNAPKLNTSNHQWLGELIFKYRLGSGSWQTAMTQSSSDCRVQSQSGSTVTVTYQNSSNTNGIRNFKVTENYSLINDYLQWSITVQNTSSQTLEIGDFGMPLPFNELFVSGTIYEERVLYHANIANDNSYVYVTRPSGVGPLLLMVPDASTGAGWEYRDRWVSMEHSAREWCASGDWADGLQVYYIHSNVIKSENRGYLPNTSLILAPNASKTYTFKFYKVADQNAMKDRLYSEGKIDVNVVPGMIVPTNQTAKFDLHTFKAITSITAQYPSQTTITSLGTVGTNHKTYSLQMSHLGQNNITVNYGNGEKTVLQFYAIAPVADALQSHATFMVQKTQWNAPGQYYDKIFDDWMMDTKSKRGSWGSWGWGDDWGWTHGEFLAEKQVYTPVASEVQAVDDYLETAVWGYIMSANHSNYKINDWLIPPGGSGSWFERSFAYPHAYNTYLSMYKTCKLYPNIITYKNSKNTYLLRAYNIYKALWTYCAPTRTGLEGEQTSVELVKALQDEGYTTEANYVLSTMTTKYNNFRNDPYPYGSEYIYDNTGEEAVYMVAKLNNNTTMMSKINQKTRASRGSQPLWYYYANPTTICGSGWWQFQYSAALIGYCMDDWTRYYSSTPELDQRMTYAAKLANLNCINSGQISSDPANIGAISWSYQASLGNYYEGSAEGTNHTLMNGWRVMAGEADLGLWGAIRILSSDVAVDPIFGLYGYGCDVTKSGSNYIITPKDGVQKKINLITEKLYLELERDQFTSANLATTKDYIEFTLKNQYQQAAHTTKLSVYGMKAGSYDVYIGGTKTSSFIATNNTQSVINLNIVTGATYNVRIQAGDGTQVNSAPIVDAGMDKSVVLPATISLSGAVSDDGLPNNTLTYAWSLQSGPGSVSFSNANALNTTVTASTAGTYVFKLTASDSALLASDTVTVIVNAAGTEVSYEAEASANTLGGSAVIRNLSSASNGKIVGNVGSNSSNTLQFNNVSTGTAGNCTLTISYINGETAARTASMSINGGASVVVSFPPTGSWSTVGTTSVTISLNSGNNTIKFSNSSAWAPDFDKITVNASSGQQQLSNVALGATPSTSYCSSWENINALNDGHDPSNSNDRSYLVYGNWDNPGTTQWVQYDFSSNFTISKCDVYWFDDNQGIDLPASCSIQYWNGSAWVNVGNPIGLGVLGNQYNTTTFTAVSTNRIRLNITAKSSYSTGILEWKVWGN